MNDASSDEDTEDDEEEEGKVFSPSELRAKNERSRKRLEQKLRSMREDLYERTALEFREMEEVKARLLENVRRLKEIIVMIIRRRRMERKKKKKKKKKKTIERSNGWKNNWKRRKTETNAEREEEGRRR